MSQPMIVWCMIAGVLLFAFVFRAVEVYYSSCHNNGRKRGRGFDIGREKEIFYVPGDVDDDDFEDL